MTLYELFWWLALVAVLAIGAGLFCMGRKERKVPSIGNKDRFEIRKYDHDDPSGKDKGRFFARLFAGNDKEIARSERYVNVADARKWPDRIRRWSKTEAEIEDLDNLVGPDDFGHQ